MNSGRDSCDVRPAVCGADGADGADGGGVDAVADGALGATTAVAAGADVCCAPALSEAVAIVTVGATEPGEPAAVSGADERASAAVAMVSGCVGLVLRETDSAGDPVTARGACAGVVGAASPVD